MSKYNVAGPSRIPLSVWIRTLLAAIFGRRRSASDDGKEIWNSLHPKGYISGLEYVPQRGPFIVAGNHFNGPGIWVGLAGGIVAYAAAKAAPSVTIRGVGVASYRNFKLGPMPVPSAVTEFVFERFYQVYGIIRMPNISQGPFARSSGVRLILAALKRDEAVILFPEGQNVSNFTMRRIQPGVGDLLRLAAKTGAPIIPAAFWEEASAFSLSFGPPIPIDWTTTRETAEYLTGRHIAEMLPSIFRGEYGDMHEPRSRPVDG